MTVAGTVETFDAANFTLYLAALVGVEPAAITLSVTAASVRVAATIRVVGEAVNVVASVQALANNASALSQAAGVTVESVDGRSKMDSEDFSRPEAARSEVDRAHQ